MKLTIVGKLTFLLLALGLAIGGWRYWSQHAPIKAVKTSVAPKTVNLPSMGNMQKATESTSVSGVPVFPASTGGSKPGVRMLGYAWNAHLGLLYANGGTTTAPDSLMARQGVTLNWQRQDDNSKLQEALVAFATDLSQGNAQPTEGAHFMTMMGDGSAAFLKGANDTLKRLGPEYQAKIVGVLGYSRGEDKFMGPASWKDNPENARGGVVSGVLRDGDWNIAMKWLADNGIKTNPDERTYDPDALNWVAANDFVDAGEKYISGYSESRPVVRNGQRTGETKEITVNGVVTWTPGDVTIAQKKGGLVNIVSTREYASQMPCVVIGIDKWMRANPATVQSLLLAAGQGGQAVESSGAALDKAAGIAAEAFKEEDGAYWAKYYKGVTEKDMTGTLVELGGSHANSTAESLYALGLTEGSSNLVAATYTLFGDVVVAQYPELVPSYYPASEAIDTTYMRALGRKNRPTAVQIAQVRPNYRKATPRRKRSVIGRRSWNITFAPNSASPTGPAEKVLAQLNRELLVASGTVVEIHGHTDNQGNNPGRSLTLSKARALSVKNWLEKRAPANFPAGRIQAQWHGESQPIDASNTPSAWAKNRRVEIVLRPL